MTRILRLMIVLCLFIGAEAAVMGQAAQGGSTTPKVKPPDKVKAVATPVSAGEMAFRNNCNRCHYAPEQLNPRITGTVVRHMRMRANLSAEDERLIMSYLAP